MDDDDSNSDDLEEEVSDDSDCDGEYSLASSYDGEVASKYDLDEDPAVNQEKHMKKLNRFH